MTEPFKQPVDPFGGQATPEQSERQRQIAHMNNRLKEQIISVFSNPHGMQLLDTLEEIFLRQPVCPPGCVKGYGYKREGENQLIIRIRSIVNQSMQPTQQ